MATSNDRYGRHVVKRLTQREWRAIDAALARVIADDNEDDVDVQAMVTAQEKVWERITDKEQSR